MMMAVKRTFDLVQWTHEKYPRPDMFCGKQDNTWIKYSTEDTRNNINWVSYGLMSMGFKRGDKIATITGNKPEWNFADMGIAQAGMIHVPIYPTIGTDEYTFILNHSDVKAIIVGNKSIFNKVSPIAEKIKGISAIFSFDPIDTVRSFSEIIEEGKRSQEKYKTELEEIKESIKPEDLVTIITGDIGIMEDNKFLRITDRKKEIFKLSAGKYIAPQPIENRLKESFFIEQAMVIGENEKFASALISPNFSYLHDWCSLHKIQFRDNAELIEIPEVIYRFSREIKEINSTMGEHEQIKRFRLVTEEWSSQSGELSPTLKLKRNLLQSTIRTS